MRRVPQLFERHDLCSVLLNDDLVLKMKMIPELCNLHVHMNLASFKRYQPEMLL